MIKANLYIARQPYKSTVWNSHLCPWLIFQASGFGLSTCILGPLKANWNEILMTITLVLIRRYKKTRPALFIPYIFFYTRWTWLAIVIKTEVYIYLFLCTDFSLTIKFLGPSFIEPLCFVEIGFTRIVESSSDPKCVNNNCKCNNYFFAHLKLIYIYI